MRCLAVSKSCILASIKESIQDRMLHWAEGMPCRFWPAEFCDWKVTSHCGETPCRGLQLLGMSGLGMGGGFERLHYLLESAFDPDGQLSITFLRVWPLITMDPL